MHLCVYLVSNLQGNLHKMIMDFPAPTDDSPQLQWISGKKKTPLALRSSCATTELTNSISLLLQSPMQVPAPVLFCCRVLQGPRGPPKLTRARQYKPILTTVWYHTASLRVPSRHSTARPPVLARRRASEGKLLNHLQLRPQLRGPITAS